MPPRPPKLSKKLADEQQRDIDRISAKFAGRPLSESRKRVIAAIVVDKRNSYSKVAKLRLAVWQRQQHDGMRIRELLTETRAALRRILSLDADSIWDPFDHEEEIVTLWIKLAYQTPVRVAGLEAADEYFDVLQILRRDYGLEPAEMALWAHHVMEPKLPLSPNTIKTTAGRIRQMFRGRKNVASRLREKRPTRASASHANRR